MKVAILADSISTQDSGIHYYGYQLVDRLLSQFPDHEYTLIASQKIEDFNTEQIIVPIRSLPMHMRWRQMNKIPKLINKLNPDMAIELAHFGPFRLKNNIKRVTVIHDLTPIQHPQYHDHMSHYMHRLLLPGVLEKAVNIVTNTKHTQRDLTAYKEGLENKISVLYPKMEKKYEKLEAPTDKKYFISIGTIEPRKNYTTLLKAFEIVANDYKDIHLIIIGKEGWKNEEFFSILNNHPYKDRITLKGYTERHEMMAYLQNCVAFVFPSFYEGFGMPILESMRFGKAMILSDIPTSRELADNAALFFDTKDYKQLAAHCIFLAESNTQKEGLEQNALDRFNELSLLADKQLEKWHNRIFV